MKENYTYKHRINSPYVSRILIISSHIKFQTVKFPPVKVKIYSLWGRNNLWGRNYPISRETITPLDDLEK
jgi:hypothetical protein